MIGVGCGSRASAMVGPGPWDPKMTGQSKAVLEMAIRSRPARAARSLQRRMGLGTPEAYRRGKEVPAVIIRAVSVVGVLAAPPGRPSRWPRPSVRLVLVIVLFLTLIVLGVIDGYQVGRAVSDLRSGTAELSGSLSALGSAPAQWTPARVDAAARAQDDAATKIDRADWRLQADPLARLFLSVPYAKDQARATLDLSSSAVDATRAGGDLVAVARLYVNLPQGSGADSGVQLIALLQSSSPLLVDADSRLTAANQRLERDSRLSLLGPLRTELKRALAVVGPARDSAHGGAEAAKLLPGLLGATGPKTYLVLLANPSELRPSGGFSGEVGTATFDQGKLTKLNLRDEFDVSPNYRDKFPPQGELGTYLAFRDNQVEIGDAGWDPDFPTSARLQERMFTSATGQQLDGTISVDPYFIASLLKVAGPVDIPGYGTFDSDNLFLRVNVLANFDPATGGKKALPAIATAIIAKVLAQPPSRWAQFAASLQDAISGRHLQVSVHDAALEAQLHALRADGSLQNLPLTEDYLMVADANVAGTKADYYIKRSMSVKVEIYPSGLNRHEVDIHYEYPPPVDATDDRLNKSFFNSTSLYRDYVRFYLPLTTTLANIGFLVDGKPAPAYGGGLKEQGQEGSHQVYGTFFTLPRGHSADLIIYYEVGLPADPPFRIYVQKQAGLVDLPTMLTVSYPGGIASRKTELSADSTLTIPW